MAFKLLLFFQEVKLTLCISHFVNYSQLLSFEHITCTRNIHFRNQVTKKKKKNSYIFLEIYLERALN